MNADAIRALRTIAIVAGAAGLLLLVPLIAMQFTDQVNWNRMDFVIAGGLFFAAGLAFTVLIARPGRRRLMIGTVILIGIALIWAELAVGLFNTPWAGS